MKKVFMFLAMALYLVACGGDDDEPTISNQQKEIDEIAAILNGKYFSIRESQTDNITTYTEITFNPYSSPRKEQWTEGNITKDIIMYGECDFVKYYNDHLLETDKHWKYNITIAYDGAQPRLYFYPEDYGVSELHYITKLSSTSFKLDDITFNKK